MKLNCLYESDKHLRKLERQFKETDAPEDHDALLTARFRYGDLPSEFRTRIMEYEKSRGVGNFNRTYHNFLKKDETEQEAIYAKAIEKLSVRARTVFTKFPDAKSYLASLPDIYDMTKTRNMGTVALIHLMKVFQEFGIPVKPWPAFKDGVIKLENYTNESELRRQWGYIIGSGNNRRRVSPEEKFLDDYRRWSDLWNARTDQPQLNQPSLQ